MSKPVFNILSIDNYATIAEVIKILETIKDKNMPLVFRTKFIDEVDVTENYIDSSHPNLSVQVYADGYGVLELLPIGPFKKKEQTKGKK